jgi:hypothetical protein
VNRKNTKAARPSLIRLTLHDLSALTIQAGTPTVQVSMGHDLGAGLRRPVCGPPH